MTRAEFDRALNGDRQLAIPAASLLEDLGTRRQKGGFCAHASMLRSAARSLRQGQMIPEATLRRLKLELEDLRRTLRP